MKKRSVLAILAGVVFTIVVTTIVDVVLHQMGIYPPWNEPMDNGLALLAVLAIPQCWLGGRLYEMTSGATTAARST